MSVLETKPGTDVFTVLLTHPEGMSGYGIAKEVYYTLAAMKKGVTPKREKYITLRDGKIKKVYIKRVHVARVYDVLKKMKDEGLITRKEVRSEKNSKLFMWLNKIDFGGLAKLINDYLPESDKLDDNELIKFRVFLESVEYEKIIGDVPKGLPYQNAVQVFLTWLAFASHAGLQMKKLKKTLNKKQFKGLTTNLQSEYRPLVKIQGLPESILLKLVKLNPSVQTVRGLLGELHQKPYGPGANAINGINPLLLKMKLVT